MINHNRVTYMITIEQNYDDYPEDASCSVFHGQFELPMSDYLTYEDIPEVLKNIYVHINGKVGA